MTVTLYGVLLFIALSVLAAFAGAVLAARGAADRGRSPVVWTVLSLAFGSVMVAADVLWASGSGGDLFTSFGAQFLFPVFAMFAAAALVRQLPPVVPRVGPGPHPVRWLEADVDAELRVADGRVEIRPAEGEPVDIDAASIEWVEIDGEAVALRAGGETRRLAPRGIARREPRIRRAEGLAKRIESLRGS